MTGVQTCALPIYTLHANIEKRKPSEEELKRLHKAIKKVTEDLEGLRFNTAISALMIFTNDETAAASHSFEIMEQFILLLAPFAPHLAEELWQLAGHQKTLAYESWPVYNESYLIEDQVEIGIQIAGKLRSRIFVQKGMAEAELKKLVLSDEIVKKWVTDKSVKKFIVVPDRLVNIIL